eukprot:TRINITY_DN2072_c0_g1_i2.p1 TRINITY_DN2072_c0_g1~~TRINITY_DN2072_c0_g1_i2.p1  ORF type:complete len:491 (+),score=53.29 TRINITY_DN2072_c0_g1_i2:59-1474(+)
MMSRKLCVFLVSHLTIVFGLQKLIPSTDAKQTQRALHAVPRSAVAGTQTSAGNLKRSTTQSGALTRNSTISSDTSASIETSASNETSQLNMSDFSESGYQAIVAVRTNGKMGNYVRTYLASKGKVVSNHSAFVEFLPEYSGMRNSHSFSSLVAALENATFVTSDPGEFELGDITLPHDFSEHAYQEIVALRSNGVMGQYVRNYLASKGKTVSDHSAFAHFLPEFSGRRNSHSFSDLVAALENASFVTQSLTDAIETDSAIELLDNDELLELWDEPTAANADPLLEQADSLLNMTDPDDEDEPTRRRDDGKQEPTAANADMWMEQIDSLLNLSEPFDEDELTRLRDDGSQIDPVGNDSEEAPDTESGFDRVLESLDHELAQTSGHGTQVAPVGNESEDAPDTDSGVDRALESLPKLLESEPSPQGELPPFRDADEHAELAESEPEDISADIEDSFGNFTSMLIELNNTGVRQ